MQLNLFHVFICHYCGKDAGPNINNSNLWAGFRDTSMHINVCWFCAERHYSHKNTTIHKNVYREIPISLIKPLYYG